MVQFSGALSNCVLYAEGKEVLVVTKLFTVKETAEALHITQSCVRQWLLRRRISSIRVGRSVRIEASEIDRVLREGRRPAEEPQEKEGRHE